MYVREHTHRHTYIYTMSVVVCRAMRRRRFKHRSAVLNSPTVVDSWLRECHGIYRDMNARHKHIASVQGSCAAKSARDRTMNAIVASIVTYGWTSVVRSHLWKRTDARITREARGEFRGKQLDKHTASAYVTVVSVAEYEASCLAW